MKSDSLSLSYSLKKLSICNLILASLVLVGGIASSAWFVLHAPAITLPRPLFWLICVLSVWPVAIGALGLLAAMIGNSILLSLYCGGLFGCVASSVVHLFDGFAFVESSVLVLVAAASCTVVVLSLIFSIQQLVTMQRVGNYSPITAAADTLKTGEFLVLESVAPLPVVWGADDV